MRIDSTHFHSQGLHRGADLYPPDKGSRPPVILMAHGFAGEGRARIALQIPFYSPTPIPSLGCKPRVPKR